MAHWHHDPAFGHKGSIGRGLHGTQGQGRSAFKRFRASHANVSAASSIATVHRGHASQESKPALIKKSSPTNPRTCQGGRPIVHP
eukprot:1158086-Pelagomonas_calceolata.AAC.13